MAVNTGRPIPTAFPVVFINSTSTTIPDYLGIIEANPSGAAAWTLPLLDSISEGSYLWIQNKSSFTITLTPQAGETIGGAGSYAIAGNYVLTLYSDRTNDWKVWSYLPPVVVGGPGSSTDNALVRWNGTSGSVIQNSNAILTDAGDLSLVGNLLIGGTLHTVGAATFDSSIDAVGPINITDATKAYQINTVNALRLNSTNLLVGPGGASSGTNNVSVGVGVSPSVTSASDNTLVGNGAGAAITIGGNNSCFGRTAGDTISTGGNNTCLGSGSDVSLGTGSFRTAVGSNVTCNLDNSVQIGRDGTDDVYAGRNFQTPSGGITSLNSVNISTTTESYQIGGIRAVYLNGTNLILGPAGIPTSTQNVLIGVAVAPSIGAAANNTITGYGAGPALTTGASNSFYGQGSGTVIDTGSSNSCFGAGATVNLAASSFRTAIGAGAVCTGDNKVQLGRDATDNVAVGRHLLVPSGTIGAAGSLVQVNKANYTQTTSNTTAVTVTSNVGNITMFGALATAAQSLSATFTIDFTAVSTTAIIKLQVTGYSGTWGTNGIPQAVIQSVSAGVATVSVYNQSAANALSGTVTFSYIAV